jgi:hypothetical protein
MQALADGVWQLSGFPRNAINVYVLEDDQPLDKGSE